MKILPEQIKIIHAVLPGEIKMDPDAKKSLVYSFTGDSAKLSTKDLSFTQANEMIIAFGGKAVMYDNWALFDKDNAQHMRLMSVVQELGWTVFNQKMGRELPDLPRLSEWLKSVKSPVKKKLKEMHTTEVSKVIFAIERMIIKG